MIKNLVKAKEISVLTKNEVGALSRMMSFLVNHGINVETIVGYSNQTGRQGNLTFITDNNQEAIDYAKDNIVSNEIKNCQVSCQQAEKLTELITFDKIIVLDPPRAGLHHEVVNKLNKVVPERIIYLSCNLSTQARDVNLLSSNYHPVFTRLYNFFPRTPHVESLVVLERN